MTTLKIVTFAAVLLVGDASLAMAQYRAPACRFLLRGVAALNLHLAAAEAHERVVARKTCPRSRG